MTRCATLASTAALTACALTLLPASAPAAGLAPPLQIAESGELVVPIHCVPLKGNKGGTCGTHKQCLYGLYGWGLNPPTGFHFHAYKHDRGQPCVPWSLHVPEPGVFGPPPQIGPRPQIGPQPRLRLIAPSGRR